jgi:protein-S-isoprenylcysteine O-methyltransferase Ste14
MSDAKDHQNSNTSIGKAHPLFELKGPLSKVDLSAWISGISYLIGLLLIGYKDLFLMVQHSPFDSAWLIISLVLFFVIASYIQYYMGLSLLANEYGKPRQLTVSGPFSYSRNPIYVAFLIPLAAFAFFSFTATAVAIVFYVLSLNLTVLRSEERDLVTIFGEAYIHYAAKVPRWIF